MKKTWLAVFYILIFCVGLLNRDLLVNWINNRDTSNLYMMFLFSAVIATIPIIPFSIFACIIGIKYGILLGMLINWTGFLIGAILYFVVSRYFLIQFFEAKIKRLQKLDYLLSLCKKNTLNLVLMLRLFPIVPHQVVHVYAGINSISFRSYLFVTAIGIIPMMFFIAFATNQVMDNWSILLAIFIFLAVLFMILLFTLRLKWKSKRILG